MADSGETRQVIQETYSKAATRTDSQPCCTGDYQSQFKPDELDHIPDEVLQKNFGCGVPTRLRTLRPGESVLDLGPGLGRDCFIAARKVGAKGRVYGIDMNPDMLVAARRHAETVAQNLGFGNVEFLEGKFDEAIPLPDGSVDVIFSNCVANLAVDKEQAYAEMFRVLRPGAMLSFSDVVSDMPVPQLVRDHPQAYADCIGGVLSFEELKDTLHRAGFVGVVLHVDSLYATGRAILNRYFGDGLKLDPPNRQTITTCSYYSVNIAAIKHKYAATDSDRTTGHRALYHGPGLTLTVDDSKHTTLTSGEWLPVGEMTAWLLSQPAYRSQITVVDPEERETTEYGCAPGCC